MQQWFLTVNTREEPLSGMSNEFSLLNLTLACSRHALRLARQVNASCNRCQSKIANEERQMLALKQNLIDKHFIVTGEQCSVEDVMTYLSSLTADEVKEYHKKYRELMMAVSH